MAIGGGSSEQMDQEVARAAMTRVLDLADVLELIIDTLDNCPFAQQQLVGEMQEDVAHIPSQFGDELSTVGDQQVLG